MYNSASLSVIQPNSATNLANSGNTTANSANSATSSANPAISIFKFVNFVRTSEEPYNRTTRKNIKQSQKTQQIKLKRDLLLKSQNARRTYNPTIKSSLKKTSTLFSLFSIFIILSSLLFPTFNWKLLWNKKKGRDEMKPSKHHHKRFSSIILRCFIILLEITL